MPPRHSLEGLLKTTPFIRQHVGHFAIYGVGFALLGLVTPLATQLVVSNLAFTGLGTSLMTLTLLTLGGLTLMQACRYGQLLLVEYMERHFIHGHAGLFRNRPPNDKVIFFELALIPKVLGKWAIDGFEILLTLAVGTLALLAYHPVFAALSLGVWLTLYAVYHLGERGLATALEESGRKYSTWFSLERGEKNDALEWLGARDAHFRILKRQILLLMAVQVIGAVVLLAGGAWLFSVNQLSLGQFVAVELIGGNVFVALGKLSKFMETHYSLQTSLTKIDHALEGGHE